MLEPCQQKKCIKCRRIVRNHMNIQKNEKKNETIGSYPVNRPHPKFLLKDLSSVDLKTVETLC